MTEDKTPDELAAAILAFTRARAIAPADPETNRLHERDTWTAIEREFADQYPGDLLDLLDDYAAAILAAMYKAAE